MKSCGLRRFTFRHFLVLLSLSQAIARGYGTPRSKSVVPILEAKVNGGGQHYTIMQTRDSVSLRSVQNLHEIEIKKCNRQYLSDFISKNFSAVSDDEAIEKRPSPLRRTRHDIEVEWNGKKAYWGFNSKRGRRLRHLPENFASIQKTSAVLCAGEKAK